MIVIFGGINDLKIDKLKFTLRSIRYIRHFGKHKCQSTHSEKDIPK